MNRFKTNRKKAKDDSNAPRPSQDLESSKSFFRKQKKAQEVEKPDLDLATALPPSDDFRTSLLMTGLSARFSMLREQDDPNTKVGKASDDSVLFPKRQSKMDFGAFRGLGDIAEVESIRTAAPFARKGSYASDDADSLKAGSMMGRSKPTEGNILFGGRQKIYKIADGANSSRTLDGGMGGRTLYNDDVGLSAFQRWRLHEKEKEQDNEQKITGEAVETPERWRPIETEAELIRSESPLPGIYNRKRETSSTLSSIPSVARNSTAATSVASFQRAPSIKEWQPASSSTPSLERNVTRTRRLYETGLNHDLHEQQSSALHRIDTLSRQRTFGSRTPDLVQNSPSPTTMGFADRWGGERRILAKGSAPNLRSMSPPATASSVGTPDLGIRVPSAGDGKANFGGAPPLSPPISEADENSLMAIGPNDRGKATALGVFQKPAQPYDESKYAQRQLQLQQGRETPTQGFRKDSDASLPTNRSRSHSSVRRLPSESRINASGAIQPPMKEESPSTSFLADADESDASPATSPKPKPSPQLVLRRPSDRRHPAFRDSALPTPLSFTSKPSAESSPVTESPAPLSSKPKDVSPEDSPTLGPTTGSGLSGMVRQHLRNDSNASSVYGAPPPTAGLESRFPPDLTEARGIQDFTAGLNPWDVQDANTDWNLDLDVTEPMLDVESSAAIASNTVDNEAFARPNRRKDSDEFASQLADGARRIRERLTTYVENDSRSSSPNRLGDYKNSMDLPPPRPNGLGILRPKDSRGSLVDRGRETSQSKAMKMLGISPGGSQATSPAREPMPEGFEQTGDPIQRMGPDDGQDMGTEESGHAGLRAFRQARRDLQRMKELETKARRQQLPPSGPLPNNAAQRPVPSRDPSVEGVRRPSRDRKPPPVFYQQRVPSEDGIYEHHPESRASSRSDRDRSGSESSHGMRSNSRPPRAREGSVARENLHAGPASFAHRPPMRSPGLPGTDIKHSPIMPPQPHPNAPAKTNHTNYMSNGNLHAQHHRGFESGQPSPISPMPSPFISSAPSTPAPQSSPPRPPTMQNHSYDNVSNIPSLNDSMRRKVKTKEISGPTFVMSTSRVATVELPPEAARNRSRSNSRSAPPLPPINPRRRQDSSKTRTVFESLRRRGDSVESEAGASMPHLPTTYSANHGDTDPYREDDEARHERRRLHKLPPQPNVMHANGRVRGNSPPINVGPPASRMVATQGRAPPSNIGMPGGMI
ncbi:hypothetical protein F5Y15DRAFT_342784 [Xylariaceae sp. FL0016]|nr:hypothetical protein F5Y15DRAFT_342784 [Xylariaceae sp. FL0016]